MLLFTWLRRPDSNRRPLGYEPNELPTAPLRDVYFLIRVQRYGLFLKQTSVLKEKYIFLQFPALYCIPTSHEKILTHSTGLFYG